MKMLDVKLEKNHVMETPAASHRDIRRQYVRGLPFPASKNFPPDHVESALAYQPRDGDIILSTYPKSGTTWVQYILHEIFHEAKIPLPTMEEMTRIMPYMESSGAEAAMSLSSPRVLKYHVPYHLIPKSPHAKYIYVIRNPYDVVVSYFHFLRNITPVDLQFEEFFDGFVAGDLIFGDYFDHLLSWYEHKDDSNILILSYDKMKTDPRKGLFKIAKFLGKGYLSRLEEDDTLVKNILQRTSFAFMKKHLNLPTTGDRKEEKDFAETNFFRKGSVGDWKNHLTPEQIVKMKTRITEKLNGTIVENVWEV